MVGRHHWLNGTEFEQAPWDGEEQRSLVCCSPWGHKELDTTETEQQQGSMFPNQVWVEEPHKVQSSQWSSMEQSENKQQQQQQTSYDFRYYN